MELILAFGLIWLGWRLRRAARRLPQPQPLRIDIHHYFHTDPGERRPVEDWEHAGRGDNVVPLRRYSRTRARL